MRFPAPALLMALAACNGPEADDTAASIVDADCVAEVDGAVNLACGVVVGQHTLAWVARDLLVRARDTWASDAHLVRVGAEVGEDGLVGDDAYRLAYFVSDEEVASGYCDTENPDGCSELGRYEGVPALGAWTLDSTDITASMGDRTYPSFLFMETATETWGQSVADGVVPADLDPDRGVYFVGMLDTAGEQRFVDGVDGTVWIPEE